MPIKECTGLETKNDVDTTLDQIEDQISIAKGKGTLSEDKYDEIMNQAETIRSYNNKLKCMLSDIPSEASNPSAIIDEVDNLITRGD